jgi:hypothetical protein
VLIFLPVLMHSMADEYKPPRTNPSKQDYVPSQNTRTWVTICLAAAVVSVLYRLLVLGYREQSALLFIGIPLVLSLLLAQSPRPKSTSGVIMKGITLSLLLFGILLFEGFICIIMAAPLFYLVGGIVAVIVGRRKSKWYNDKMNCTCISVIALMSLEGVTDALSFGREEIVVVEREVSISPAEVMKKLAEQPSFDEAELPLFLKLGFPTPQDVNGQGIALGDERVIHFAGGEGEPGDVVVKVVESSSNRVVFALVKDDSHIDHWLGWKKIIWEVDTTAAGKTEVSISMSYTRKLDPAWYFKPVERYGVSKAGEYFLESMFDE